jgi:hypothetical protein
MFIVNQKEKLDTFVAKFDKLPMADEKVWYYFVLRGNFFYVSPICDE